MAMENESKTPNLEQRANGNAEAYPDVPTVGAMAPEYPKHRDVLIVCVSILILIVLVAGGYFFLHGRSVSLPTFPKEPVQFLRNLFTGGDTFDICSEFVRSHPGLFKDLGRDLEWSLVKKEVRVVNRDKRTRILLKVKGSKSEGFVYFLLRKYGETWRILSVAMKTGEGKFRRIYPGKGSKTSNV